MPGSDTGDARNVNGNQEVTAVVLLEIRSTGVLVEQLIQKLTAVLGIFVYGRDAFNEQVPQESVVTFLTVLNG
ncbi:hypothetical protein AFA91_02095 [Mycolicibacterium goodii]|uniref:Uncharacterized protein n=1 Tax=Mycolicibacterium goodii TaxID=134601 RepID=A0A0K0X086_MYCGD|nr:hypothetical protein AFA91_02095 [Mycolicibacterium goodii]